MAVLTYLGGHATVEEIAVEICIRPSVTPVPAA
jgi:hypothetical protein